MIALSQIIRRLFSTCVAAVTSNTRVSPSLTAVFTYASYALLDLTIIEKHM